jgi:Ca-activated chloride channel family protein
VNRKQAEKLLAALIFDDLDEASKAELQAYLQTDDELRERLADMRMAAKLANDAVNDGPAPVLSEERLENLRRLAGLKVIKLRGSRVRWLTAIAAVLVFGLAMVGLLVPSMSRMHAGRKLTSAEAAQLLKSAAKFEDADSSNRPVVRESLSKPMTSPAKPRTDLYASDSILNQSGPAGMGGMGGYGMGGGNANNYGVEGTGSMGGFAGGQSGSANSWSNSALTKNVLRGAVADELRDQATISGSTRTAPQPVVPSGPQVAASTPSSAKPVDSLSKADVAKTSGGLPMAGPAGGGGWGGAMGGGAGITGAASARLDYGARMEAEAARRQEDIGRDNRIKDNLARADEYMKQQKYDAALGQVESVLAVDPLNNKALTLHQTLNDTIYQRKDVALDAQSNKERANSLQNVSEAMIPYSNEVTYPKNWRELSSTVAAPAQPEQKPGRDGDAKLSLNFQDASLDTVLKYLSDKTGLTVTAAGVPLDERVTVIARQPISVDAAVSLINSALLDKDVAATRTGKSLTISTVAKARQKTLPVVHVTKDSDVPLDSDEIMTFVMPVRYVDAQVMSNVLMPMLPEYATLEANRDGNALIITDSASNVRRVMKILQALDTRSDKVDEIKMWRLTNAQASTTSQLINNVFQKGGPAAGAVAAGKMNMMFGGRGGMAGGMGGRGASAAPGASSDANIAATAAADDRTNSVIVKGPPEVLAVIDGMMSELDRRTTEIADVRVKQLRYADPLNTAQAINQLFGQTTQGTGRNGMQQMGPGGGGQQASMSSALSITAVADSRTNTVVVTGPKNLLDVVINVVESLDQQIPNIADVQTFHLQYADAANTATLVNGVFGTSRTTTRSTSRGGTTNQQIQGGGQGGTSGATSDVVAVASADTQTNSVVVSGAPETLDVIKNVIAELDQNPEQERRVFVYPLKNATASGLVTVLNNHVNELRALNNSGSSPTGTTSGAGAMKISEGAGDLSGRTYFQADNTTNSLIILTSTKNYQLVKPIIDNLDKSVGQVLDKNPTEVTRDALSKSQPTKQNARTTGEDSDTLPAASRFKVVPVNPWVMTERDALSTFALDVDTASYALCRRYIRSGYLPPIGAVRMEEFVNAFDYAYPQRNDATFSVYADGAPSPFAPAGQDVTLLKIAVKARTVGRDQRRPAHLVFVVDASASMGQSDRLPLVQSALNLLVDELSDGDRVSLVTCAKDASLHLEAVPAKQKDAIRQKIDAIQPAGPTNLLAGLRLGYATARKAFVAGQINQVVLCSDGVANVGLTDANDVLREVAGDRKQGITITCVGVGYGAYNDAFLEGLADHGDGRYVFLDSTPEAQAALVGQLASTLQTVAKDARIQVQFNPNRVRRYRLIGYENRDIEDKRFRDDTVEAGAVGSGQCSTALYEVELAESSSKDTGAEIGTVFVRYRNTDTNQMEEISKPLARSIVRPRSIQEDPRFFLAAGAARLAEWLRQSEHVRNTSLSDVQRVLDQVSAALPLDRDIHDLATLAHQAENLPRAP